MKVSPCKDCEKKGCGTYHDVCDKYQQYKVDRESMMKRVQKSSDLDHAFKDMIISKKTKQRRW